MSNASLQSETNSLDESTATDRPLVARLRTVPESILATCRAAGFWTAIALPFLYIPLLFAGPDTQAELVAFLGLLCVNVVALFFGRSYRREE
jgi:hypothetical protein